MFGDMGNSVKSESIEVVSRNKVFGPVEEGFTDVRVVLVKIGKTT